MVLNVVFKPGQLFFASIIIKALIGLHEVAYGGSYCFLAIFNNLELEV